MSHRAEQIIDAIAALIRASLFSGSVYKHRALSLSEGDGELPAISVDFGDDVPPDADGASNVAFLDSLLAVETSIYLRDVDEPSVKSALLDARRVIHAAVMNAPPFDLGLPWIHGTRYQGADKPELDASAEYIAGTLVCRWTVYYRMNITDPS